MGLRFTLEDILRISLRAGRISPKAVENINLSIFNGLCAPENLAALAVLYAERNMEDFRNWLHERLSEVFPEISEKVDEPLKDPTDTGEVRAPTLDDFREYWRGNPLWSTVFRAQFGILKGDDDRHYVAIAEVEPKRPWAYFQFTMLPEDVTDHFPPSPTQRIEFNVNMIGFKDLGDKLMWWIPKNKDPEKLQRNYLKYIASPETHNLSVSHQNFNLDLEFKRLGIPCWYNKGRKANVRIGGFPFIGFEAPSSIEGRMYFQGREVKLKGYGAFDSVHWYLGRDLWGPHDWILFVSDRIYGLLLHEHDSGYMDGAVYDRTKSEYLIPKDFKIKYLKYEPYYTRYDEKVKLPIELGVKVSTLRGEVEFKGKAMGRYGYTPLTSEMICEEIAYRIEGTFNREDGKVKFEGYAWHEILTGTSA